MESICFYKEAPAPWPIEHIDFRETALRNLILGSVMACLAATAANADSMGDPTFSGIAARATCYVRNVTQCRGATCIQPVSSCQGDLCGTFVFNMKTRQYSFNNAPLQPIQITGVSPAELNKPLGVDFTLALNNHAGTARLQLQPNHAGGYAASTVIDLPLTDDQNRAVAAITGTECTIFPDEP